MIRPNTNQEILYRTVKAAGPQGISVDTLLDVMYGHRVDGGPEHARRVLWVTKYNVNRRHLKGTGERIIVVHGKNWRFQGRKYFPGSKARYVCVPS